jgi:hypothetical protein
VSQYNEVNSRKVPVQLGDLAAFHLAIATADDYLQWLVKIRGERHGAVETPMKLAHEARKIISRIMQDVDNMLLAEESAIGIFVRRRSVAHLTTLDTDNNESVVQPVLGTDKQLSDQRLASKIRFEGDQDTYLALVELWERRGELKSEGAES